jgi:predicted branched-subunit amino acid permease
MRGHVPFSMRGVQSGAILGLPLLLSTGAAGLVMGIACRQAGMSLPLAALFSAGVFSGTAQALAVQLWAATPPLFAILFAAGAVNVRYLVMGARLAAIYPDVPRRIMLPTMAIYGDGSWLIAASEVERGRRDAGVLLGASAVTILGWVGGTIAGFIAGVALAGPWAAAAAFVPLGFIVAYVPDQWRGRMTALPWAVAGTISIISLQFVAPQWAMLTGGFAGTMLAVALDWRRAGA